LAFDTPSAIFVRMSNETHGYQRFFAELKRRQVFKVTAIYGAVAFGILQVADPLAGALALPDSFLRLVVALLLLGFPVALVLAWAFELTPDGVRKAESAAPGEIEAIVAQPAARRWPAGLLALAGIVALVLGSVWVGRQTASGRELSLAIPEAHASDLSTLAILPFENVGDDEDNEVLASGLHMDLQDQLGRLSALRVTSPMSVREYEATEKGDQEIAAELGVDYLLRGSVRRSGSRARIFVQLVDAQTSENLWTDQFDREVTAENLFDIQSDIARQVAGQLASELSPSDLAALDQEPPSDDLAAIAAYNRARQVFFTPGPGDELGDAVDLAERAVELDPEFVDAWAFLARLRSVQAGVGEADRGLASDAVQRAESLAPDGVQAITARAYFTYYVEQDFAAALDQMREAERLAPSDVDVISGIAYLQRRLGRWDEALASMQRAVAVSPRSPDLLSGYSGMLSQMGRFTAADFVAERALQIDPSIPYVRSAKVSSTLGRHRDISRARGLATELGLDASEPAEASALYDLAIYEGDLDRAARIADGLPPSGEVVGELGRLWDRGWARLLAGQSSTSIGDSILALDWAPTGTHGLKQLGEAYALSFKGDEDGAWTALEEAIQLARTSDDAATSAVIRANAAIFAPVIGRPEEALGLLDEIIELPGSFIYVVDLLHSPAFLGLRDDPRFDEILERRRAFEEQAARDAEADRPWLP
jgi:TolB-like protein/Tfp pilus assembly protein PilF